MFYSQRYEKQGGIHKHIIPSVLMNNGACEMRHDRNEYHRFECKPMLNQIKEERNNGNIRSFFLILALVGICLSFF